MNDFPITDRVREKYPEESKAWEEKLRKAEDPKYRGCYTCGRYRGIEGGYLGHFAEVENVDEDDKDWLPWDTEDNWVYCSLQKDIETPLKINCDDWKYKNNSK